MRKLNLLFLLIFSSANATTVEDGRGQAVRVDLPAKRIVSTFLGGDEILKEILVRAGSLHHLQAVSTLADDPAYSHIAPVPASIKARAGDDLEAVLKLKPDLAVVASFNRPEFVRRLDQAKVRTFVLHRFHSFTDIEQNIRTLGLLTGETKAAEQLATEFRNALKQTSQPPTGQKKKTVLTFMANGSVHGADTTFDDIARYAGTENLAASKNYKGWMRLSPEVLASLNPDFLVASGDPGNKAQILDTIRKTAGFANMPAAKAGRVIVIPGRDLSAVSHHVVAAVKALHEAVYQ